MTILILVVTPSVIVLWAATPWLISMIVPWIQAQDWTTPLLVQGQFGDLFGSVNALFSGFAFAGVIFTVYLQQHELKTIHTQTADTLRVTLYAATFAKVYDILDDEKVIEARHLVNGLDKKPYDLWDDEDKSAIKTLLRAYNIAGIMVKRGLLPEHYVVEDWAPSLRSTWRTLERFVREQRKIRGDENHWLGYQMLAEKAKDVPPSNPDEREFTSQPI